MAYFKKISEYLFYLFIFLLPVQTRFILKPGFVNFGYLEYGTFSLYFSDLILVLFLSFLILFLLSPKKKKLVSFNFFREKNKIDYPLLILIFLEFLAFIAIIWSPYKFLAFYKYIWLVMGMLLFLIISHGRFFNRLKFIYSLLAGIFLQSVLAIYQFVTQSSFASKLLGLALHDSSVLGTAVVEAYNKNGLLLRWLRSYGGLDHPNILGGLMSVGLILTIFLLINRRGWGIKEKNKKIFLLVNYSLIFFFAVALLFSFSRSAYLSFVSGVIVLLFCFGRRILNKRINWRHLDFKLILIFSTIFIIIWALAFSLIDVRFSGSSRLENISQQERISGYHEAKDIIFKKPVVGWGPGNYYVALYLQKPYYSAYYYQPVHNLFLLITAELGVLGLVLFLTLIFLLIYRKLSLKPKNALSLAILIQILIIALVDHWLWSLHFGVLFFWLLLGIISWKNEEN